MTNTKILHEQLQSAPSVSMSDSCELYESPEPLALLKIDGPLCNAVIAVQGAQLLEFTPKGSSPWLWLSPKAVFQKNHPIRGGIPICAPWFGVNQQDPSKPKHGFVRTQPWQLINITESATGVIKLVFQFVSEIDDLSHYAHEFSLKLTLSLSDHIDISFSVHNLSSSAMPFSWALHSYFSVDNLKATRVNGLEDITYLDATDAFLPIKQNNAVCFKSEVDRVYENVGSEQKIIGSPSLSIQGVNCPTAIIWNPGTELAEQMADITTDHYDEYICVERGAAFGNAWNIQPNESATATLAILVSH